MQKTAIIVGSGCGGLGAAALLGKAGYKVTVLEKNETLGGRAGMFEAPLEAGKPSFAKSLSTPLTSVHHKTQDSVHEQLVEPLEEATAALPTPDHTQTQTTAFTFDMGPCWYLMPELFDHFFELLEEKIGDHLDLVKLAPSYHVFYKDRGLMVEMFSDLERDLLTVNTLEPGAGKALQKYLADASRQYETLQTRFTYKNRSSLLDFLKPDVLAHSQNIHPFISINSHVSEYFKSEALRQLVEYPSVILGINPYSTPALYTVLNQIDFSKGVYYPMGGIHSIIKALRNIGKKYDVEYRFNSPVIKIIVKQGRAVGVQLKSGEEVTADIVISNAALHHTEQELLEVAYRPKSAGYWQRRIPAPSALMIHLGVKGKLPSLSHHNLLYGKNWQRNFAEIFHYPQWPTDPTLYICNPNKTDPSRAPAGYENLSILVPIAANLDYNPRILEAYAEKILTHIETSMKLDGLRERIVFKRLFSVKDFDRLYHSYGGSAFGSAHTLRQNLFFQPRNTNKKVKNLYYVGADTNSGIGLPGTLVSAELMFKRLINDNTADPLKPAQLKSS